MQLSLLLLLQSYIKSSSYTISNTTDLIKIYQIYLHIFFSSYISFLKKIRPRIMKEIKQRTENLQNTNNLIYFVGNRNFLFSTSIGFQFFTPFCTNSFTPQVKTAVISLMIIKKKYFADKLLLWGEYRGNFSRIKKIDWHWNC